MGFVIAGIILGLLVLFFISCYLANIVVSKKVFPRRGDASISIKYPLPSDYTNLNVRKDYFLNNKKARISLYEYCKKDTKPLGLVLLSHGIGGGHFYLLPLINYLCERGLMVLAFDHYASGTSEGKKIESLAQGALDVKYALKYIDKHYDLPLYVLGHSWGGYSVAQGLRYSKKILKCVSIAGLDSEAAMATGPKPLIPLIRAFVKICGFTKYGKYSFYTSYSAFKKTHTKVLYIQGKTDLTVSPKTTGYRYQKAFKNKKNIQVIMMDKKGHAPIVTFESQLAQMKVMKQFGMLGGNLVPLDVYIDFNKNNVPDMDVYKMIGDYLLN